MSFRCGICGVQQPPRSKATRVITETREKVYPVRMSAHHYRDREGHEQVRDDPGGKGVEVVREVLACESCSALLQKKDEEINTSDIPEVTDWSKAERGKFYRKQVN